MAAPTALCHPVSPKASPCGLQQALLLLGKAHLALMFYRAVSLDAGGDCEEQQNALWLVWSNRQVMSVVATCAIAERSCKGFAGQVQSIHCWVLVMADDLKPTFAGNNSS